MTLDIDSEIFKPLCEDSPKGLGKTKLGRALHSCYSRMWSVQLTETSDGTSWYDKPYGTGSTAYSGGGYSGIEACQHWGHYWPKGSKDCVDCGEVNPDYPAAGPPHTYPAGYPKSTPGTDPSYLGSQAKGSEYLNGGKPLAAISNEEYAAHQLDGVGGGKEDTATPAFLDGPAEWENGYAHGSYDANEAGNDALTEAEVAEHSGPWQEGYNTAFDDAEWDAQHSMTAGKPDAATAALPIVSAQPKITTVELPEFDDAEELYATALEEAIERDNMLTDAEWEAAAKAE
jgi:hypothetical protein